MPKCVPPYYYTSGLSGPFSHLATICEDQSSAEIFKIILHQMQYYHMGNEKSIAFGRLKRAQQSI